MQETNDVYAEGWRRQGSRGPAGGGEEKGLPYECKAQAPARHEDKKTRRQDDEKSTGAND
jgi:hypothetical protein